RLEVFYLDDTDDLAGAYGVDHEQVARFDTLRTDGEVDVLVVGVFVDPGLFHGCVGRSDRLEPDGAAGPAGCLARSRRDLVQPPEELLEQLLELGRTLKVTLPLPVGVASRKGAEVGARTVCRAVVVD